MPEEDKKISLEIKDEGLNPFSENAISKFTTELTAYAIAVIKETNLIAEAEREEGTKIEITSTTVIQGFKKKKNRYQNNKTKTIICGISKGLSPLCLFFAGILANDGFASTMETIGFAILVAIACIAILLSYMLDNGGN